MFFSETLERFFKKDFELMFFNDFELMKFTDFLTCTYMYHPVPKRSWETGKIPASSCQMLMFGHM